jgi:hypothetical protein
MTSPDTSQLIDPALGEYEPQLGRDGKTPDDPITGTTPKATLASIAAGEHLDASVRKQLGLGESASAQPAQPRPAQPQSPPPAQPAPPAQS